MVILFQRDIVRFGLTIEERAKMRVLVACEESQRVCISFRNRGHEAYSCDLLPCSGGHPEWHIQGDCLKEIAGGGYDLIIAHPPCTYLTVTGNRWFDVKKYGQKAIERQKLRQGAIDFFMQIANAKCDKIAIENPVGAISSAWRKPDQIIQPYEYGHPMTKKTCLWLKNLPLLKPTNIVEPEFVICADGKRYSKVHVQTFSIKDPQERAKIRSKTFWGIADAMASQWGNYNIE